jgi:hypothetical protein
VDFLKAFSFPAGSIIGSLSTTAKHAVHKRRGIVSRESLDECVQ